MKGLSFTKALLGLGVIFVCSWYKCWKYTQKKIPPVQGDDKGKEIIEYKETKKNENNYISTIKGESVVDFVFFFISHAVINAPISSHLSLAQSLPRTQLDAIN